MKGTLYRQDNKWVVSCWLPDPYYKGSPGSTRETIHRFEVSPDSLSNPHLSTYWVEGREVEFEVILNQDFPLSSDMFDYAKIIHDDYVGEDGWTRIERELSEQDINEVYETMKWLKENYNPPIRK